MAITLYLSVLYASSVWAADENAAAAQATSLLKNLFIGYVIAELLDTRAAQRLALWSLLAAGTLMAGITVIQAATQTYGNTYLGLAQSPLRQIVGMAQSFRSSGPIGDPNFYALVLAVLVPIALLRARDERRLDLRLAAIAVAILLVAAIVLTYSRGGLVTLLIAVILFLPFGRVRVRYLLSTLVLLVPVFFVVPAVYWQRIGTLAQGDPSIQGRAGSQLVGLAMFYDHPFLGVGANNYASYYLPYSLRLNAPYAAEAPHNLYVAVLAETGLVGLLAFAGAVTMTVRGVWRRHLASRRSQDPETAGIAIACALAIVTYAIGAALLPIAYPRYLWVLVGLALAVAAPARDDRVATATNP